MRSVKNIFGRIFMVMPVGVGIGAVMRELWWMQIVAIVLMFFCIGINPLCREMEIIWVFVLSFFTLIPITIYFLHNMFAISAWTELIGWLLLFFMIMSIEVLVMTIVGTVIWPIREKRKREV